MMAAKRKYRVYGTGGAAMPTEMQIIDAATPFLRRIAAENPAYIRKALKSCGWWLSGEIKKGIASGAPGGQVYAPFSRIIKDEERGVLRRKRGRHAPLGKLRKAVGYRYYHDSMRVLVGWLSASAEYLGTIHEKGKEYPITSKERKLFWISGIPLSEGKTRIIIPKRPTIGPEFREHAPQIVPYVESKIWGYIREEEKRT